MLIHIVHLGAALRGGITRYGCHDAIVPNRCAMRS